MKQTQIIKIVEDYKKGLSKRYVHLDMASHQFVVDRQSDMLDEFLEVMDTYDYSCKHAEFIPYHWLENELSKIYKIQKNYAPSYNGSREFIPRNNRSSNMKEVTKIYKMGIKNIKKTFKRGIQCITITE